MDFSKTALIFMIRGAAEAWTRSADLLGGIDSKYGDGDHGYTMGRIAALARERCSDWESSEGALAGEFLEDLGAGIMALGGGSAGPLYGTLIEGLAAPFGTGAVPAPGADLSPELVRAMLRGSLDTLSDVTKAGVGDKTMMDAVIPAVAAAESAESDVSAVLSAAATAAAEGAEATKEMVAGYGRARSYGERTLGTPDAGAVSAALFFKGMSDGYEEWRRST